MMSHTYKIVIIGESMVGKTSLMLRYIKEEWIRVEERTVNPHCLNKVFTYKEEKFSLNIWDTAGEEKFHALAPLFYRDADGAVLVFDLSNRESFILIEKWFSELQDHAFGIQIVLVGNKCDKYPLQITNEEAKSLADKYSVPYLSVSALNGVNVQDVFTTLTLDILEYKEKNLPMIKPTKRKSIKLNEGVAKKEDKGCC